MKITRTDAIIICLSALLGFIALSGVSIRAAFVAGAPSGALGGIIVCLYLHLRRNLKTWSPLQSPEVREICAQMTDAERAKIQRSARLYGLWGFATFAGPVCLAVSYPNPVEIVLASVLIATHIACIPRWLKMQKRFLSSTAWAREHGVTPERIRLFAFRS